MSSGNGGRIWDPAAAAAAADRAQAVTQQIVIRGAQQIFAPIAAAEIEAARGMGRPLDVAAMRKAAKDAQALAMLALEPFGLVNVRETQK